MNVKLTIASVLLLAAVDRANWQGQVEKWNTTQTNTIGFRIDTSGSSRSGINDGSDVLFARGYQSWTDVMTCSPIALVRTWAMYVERRPPPATTPTTSGSRATRRPGATDRGPSGSRRPRLSVGSACSGGGRRPYNGCYIVDADIQFNEVSYPSNRGRWGTR